VCVQAARRRAAGDTTPATGPKTPKPRPRARTAADAAARGEDEGQQRQRQHEHVLRPQWQQRLVARRLLGHGRHARGAAGGCRCCALGGGRAGRHAATASCGGRGRQRPGAGEDRGGQPGVGAGGRAARRGAPRHEGAGVRALGRVRGGAGSGRGCAWGCRLVEMGEGRKVRRGGGGSAATGASQTLASRGAWGEGFKAAAQCGPAPPRRPKPGHCPRAPGGPRARRGPRGAAAAAARPQRRRRHRCRKGGGVAACECRRGASLGRGRPVLLPRAFNWFPGAPAFEWRRTRRGGILAGRGMAAPSRHCGPSRRGSPTWDPVRRRCWIDALPSSRRGGGPGGPWPPPHCRRMTLPRAPRAGPPLPLSPPRPAARATPPARAGGASAPPLPPARAAAAAAVQAFDPPFDHPGGRKPEQQ
jgi:hypothetical protein